MVCAVPSRSSGKTSWWERAFTLKREGKCTFCFFLYRAEKKRNLVDRNILMAPNPGWTDCDTHGGQFSRGKQAHALDEHHGRLMITIPPHPPFRPYLSVENRNLTSKGHSREGGGLPERRLSRQWQHSPGKGHALLGRSRLRGARRRRRPGLGRYAPRGLVRRFADARIGFGLRR